MRVAECNMQTTRSDEDAGTGYLYVQDSDALVVRAAEDVLTGGVEDDAPHPVLMAVEGHQTDPLQAAAAMRWDAMVDNNRDEWNGIGSM